MLKGTYTFIRVERNQGVSKKDVAYDFCTVSLSDGIESFTLELDKEAFVNLEPLKKGEKVDVELEVGEKFNRPSFTITSVKKSAAFSKVS